MFSLFSETELIDSNLLRADLSIKVDMSIRIVAEHFLHLLLLGQLKDVMLLDDLVIELGRRLVSGSHSFLQLLTSKKRNSSAVSNSVERLKNLKSRTSLILPSIFLILSLRVWMSSVPLSLSTWSLR